MNLPLGLGDFSDDGAMALTKDIVKSGRAGHESKQHACSEGGEQGPSIVRVWLEGGNA